MPNDSQTLSQRLAVAKLSVAEALRLAISLGDALRRVHEQGRFYGELTPSAVRLTGERLELLPAEAGSTPGSTPYAAPELLEGHPADACSDIYSFGAILYEMLSGRCAFEGGKEPPPPLGHPELDRLVANCLAKDRTQRWQRMQQVMMELKLLAASSRRSQTVLRPPAEAVTRAEMELLEARMVSRLAQYDHAIADLDRAATQAVDAVRAQLVEIDRQFAAAQQRAAEETRRELAGLDAAMAGAIHGLEQTVDAQAHAIEGARAGLARTDDLVERVVEALESLQSIVLDHADSRAA